MNDVAARCRKRFEDAKAAGLKLSMLDVERVIREECRRTKKPSQMTDEEWIESLEREPHLKSINVRSEISACALWCKNNGRQATRRTIVNWLNKAERTVSIKANGGLYANGMKPAPPPAPDGWEMLVQVPAEDDPAWSQVQAALNCRNFYMLPKSYQARVREQQPA